MVYNREGYAPWSLTRKAGVQSATVDGDIEVPQYIQPTLDTGFVDDKGDWKGSKSTEETFTIDATHEAVGAGASVLSPQPSIDMSGFTTLQFAVKVSNGGNYDFRAVFGPDTTPFANLTPVEAAQRIKIVDSTGSAFENIMDVDNHSCTADVWIIFTILADRTKEQKNMQIMIINDSGGNSNIEFAYRRIV